MTPNPDRLPDDVARLLDQLADEDAARVLEDARANAIAGAQAAIERALVERLLARCALPAADSDEASVAPSGAGSTSEPAEDQGELMYLYGVIGVDGAQTAADGVGPDATVELVVHGRLAAVVSRVSFAEFGNEHLKRNLERMDWLEHRAPPRGGPRAPAQAVDGDSHADLRPVPGHAVGARNAGS